MEFIQYLDFGNDSCSYGFRRLAGNYLFINNRLVSVYNKLECCRSFKV